jgi:hypothetical protein
MPSDETHKRISAGRAPSDGGQSARAAPAETKFRRRRQTNRLIDRSIVPRRPSGPPLWAHSTDWAARRRRPSGSSRAQVGPREPAPRAAVTGVASRRHERGRSRGRIDKSDCPCQLGRRALIIFALGGRRRRRPLTRLVGERAPACPSHLIGGRRPRATRHSIISLAAGGAPLPVSVRSIYVANPRRQDYKVAPGGQCPAAAPN